MKHSTANTRDRRPIVFLVLAVCIVALGPGPANCQDPFEGPGMDHELPDPDVIQAETYEVADDSAFTEERPCGQNTLARVQAENGNTITFCVVGESGILVSELAPVGAEMNVDRFNVKKNGPLHLFKSVAGTGAVAPERLVTGDAKWRLLEEPKGFRATGEEESALGLTGSEKGSAPDWCNSGSAWVADRCYNSYHDPDDVWFCGSGAYSSHQRTCSSYISGSTPCAWIDSDLVSCNGRTNHRIYWRDSTSNSFSSLASIVVYEDNWNHFVFFESDSAGDDFRVKGYDYDSSAWHRYYTGFEAD